MKQVFNQIAKSTVFASLLLATIFLFSNCSKEEAGLSGTLTYSLSGNASASQATPPNNSNGSGTFSGTYDASTRIMTYTTTWTNLTGAPVAGGLFAGATGQTGATFAAWSMGSGLGVSGSFSSSTVLNADQEANLLAGKTYYILSTAANASGEIRGQITASANQ
jgi:hypothetical protein